MRDSKGRFIKGHKPKGDVTMKIKLDFPIGKFPDQDIPWIIFGWMMIAGIWFLIGTAIIIGVLL